MSLTAEQKQERTLGIGGSDAAAIMGLSPYRTPVDIWLEKTSGFLREDDDPYEFDIKRIGSLIEPAILDMYSEVRGVKVIRPKKPYICKKHPFLRGNFDGRVLGKKVIVEAKFSRTPGIWGETFYEIPVPYQYQSLHYRIVYNADRVDVCALINGSFRIYEYTKNDVLESKYLEVAETFWLSVVENNPPPNIVPDDYFKVTSIEDSEVEVDVSVKNKIQEITRLTKQISQFKSEIDSIKLDILENHSMGCRVLKYQDERLASIVSRRVGSGLDSKRFKVTEPQLYQQYYREGEIKSFLRIRDVENVESIS